MRLFDYKRIMSAVVALLMAMTMVAAVVNSDSARKRAAGFMSSRSSGKMMASSGNALRLAHVEHSAACSDLADFYVFNAADGSGFVIIAGDDRAVDVLGYGDGVIDMNNIPEGLNYLFGLYRQQMEYLFTHPDLTVNKKSDEVLPRPSVEPMLAAMWNQDEPFYNDCPIYNGEYCVTGCSCTSLSILMYHWKYPTGQTPYVPAYITEDLGIYLERLEPTTFDWDNMIDVYAKGRYTEQQAAAVAHLMRYVGQNELMDYTPSGSGAASEDILATAKYFGYDAGAQILYKTYWWGEERFNDTDWACIMHDELEAGRPMVYVGYDTSFSSGHAFNVDGYDSVEDMFHVNFGWGGSANGYYVLNGFDVFDTYQQMIIGVEPPLTVPTIKPQMSRVHMDALVEHEETYSLIVNGRLLNGNVSLLLNDELGYFEATINQSAVTLPPEVCRVNIKYKPMSSGTHIATLTLRSNGAEDVDVTLIGKATLETYDPLMLTPMKQSSTSVLVQWQDKTPLKNVACYRLELNTKKYSDLRLKDYFDKGEYDGSSTKDCSSRLDEITSVPGWTGSKVFFNNGYLTIGSSTQGWLETPLVDMSGNEGLMTVKVRAKCPNNTASSVLKISSGDSDTCIVVGPIEAIYCVMLPVATNVSASVRLANLVKGQKVLVSGVRVYAGDDYSPVDPADAERYENISDKSYLIDGLKYGIYATRVQAEYIDGTVSSWSNYAQFNITWEKCDVNHDGEINIADVNAVINSIMTMQYGTVGDVNQDGEVNIADVNAVIDRILQGP